MTMVHDIDNPNDDPRKPTRAAGAWRPGRCSQCGEETANRADGHGLRLCDACGGSPQPVGGEGA